MRPLFLSILSVAAAFIAKAADDLGIEMRVPNVAPESIETLLSITAGSMLVIATLAVGSMVSAYASASSTATPRSFSLLVSDDLSQNALSTFLGAFIFTFVALVAIKNDFYAKSGLFVIFTMTVVVVAFVLVTFMRWVDWIARLGRIGTTVHKVEAAGIEAFNRNRLNRRLGGAEMPSNVDLSNPVFADKVGYVQHVNMEALQQVACQNEVRIILSAIPGVFAAPGRPLAHIQSGGNELHSGDLSELVRAFEIGNSRVYDDDPRFALVALSEIASRALSPAVNDPGTAISIFGSFIRLFEIFSKPLNANEPDSVRFDRICVPEMSVDEMLEDAFRAIARDGAGIIEVQIRLQKTLHSIASMNCKRLADAAKKESRSAIQRAEKALKFDSEMCQLKAAAEWFQ